MPVVDAAKYDWLSGSELEVAGCVTVVPEADAEAVAGAFGHEAGDGGTTDRDDRFAACASGWLDDRGDEVWVASAAGAAVVFEFNGFEGTRTEVLRVASRIGAPKVAASLFWNVNGAVLLTCARRGQVVASVDLSYVDDEDLSELPRALRPLARLLTADDGADPLAIGAAMVETYTGVGFTREDLDRSSRRSIVAVQADLQTYRPGARQFGPLTDSIPELVGVLATLETPALRRVAEWAARAAVAEAHLGDEPAVRAVVDQFGNNEAPKLPPALEALRRRLTADSQQLSREVDEADGESSVGALAGQHAHLSVNAVQSLRCTAHPDAFSAAMGALSSATSAFACARLERGARFTEDAHGRRLDGFDPPPRLPAFTEVVRAMLAAEPGRWDDLAASLPAPEPASDMAAAAEVDRRLQEAGAFDTWQLLPSASAVPGDEDDDGFDLVAVHDRVAEVRDRYEALERRDAALAARGPITAGAVSPQNAGGFAVSFSDGVRVERLPAGHAAGSLFLTFVFTDEFGLDPWDGRGSRPEDRITYRGPDGPIRWVGGSGGARSTMRHWHTTIDVTDRPWVELGYLDGGRSVASERIDIASLAPSES